MAAAAVACSAIVLGDLPVAERDKMLTFLAQNKVNFIFNPSTETFTAKVQIFPPGHTFPEDEAPEEVEEASGNNGRAGAPAAAPQGRSQHYFFRPGKVAQRPRVSPRELDQAKQVEERIRAIFPDFCNELPPMKSLPREMPLIDLGRFIEDVYAERYMMETQKLKLEAKGAAEDPKTSKFMARAQQDFARTTVTFAKKHRGVPSIVEQTCWGMALAVLRFRDGHDEVDLFSSFLEGTYDATDLLFFLHARDITRQVLRLKTLGWIPVNKGEQHMILGKPGFTPTGKHVLEGRKRPAPAPFNEARQYMDAAQVVRVIRGCVSGMLQGYLLRRFVEREKEQMKEYTSDDWNFLKSLRTRAEADKPYLHVFTFLKTLTAEYHNARETLECLSPALRLGMDEMGGPAETGVFGQEEEAEEAGVFEQEEGAEDLGLSQDELGGAELLQEEEEGGAAAGEPEALGEGTAELEEAAGGLEEVEGEAGGELEEGGEEVPPGEGEARGTLTSGLGLDVGGEDAF